jgi:hypothetical protein
MNERKFALKSKIGELMALLETIRANHIDSVAVEIANKETRNYSVDGLFDALSSLATEVTSSSEAVIAGLEEKYEHDRSDVFRIVGKLAEIAAGAAGGQDFVGAPKHTSTF